MSLSDTSFWNARVGFHSANSTNNNDVSVNGSSFWDNPDGNPSPPADEYSTPFLALRDLALSSRLRPSFNSRDSLSQRDLSRRQNSTNSTVPDASPSSDTLWYEHPFKYEVRNTGYYCTGV